MTKSPLVLLYIISLIFTGHSGESAQKTRPIHIMSLNVKDFGAKGDGIADDTEAIKKALNEQGRLTQAVPMFWTAAFPEVVFPAGTYRITRTLLAGMGGNPAKAIAPDGKPKNTGILQGAGFTYLRGTGKAVIKQIDPAADIIYLGCAINA